VSTKKIVLIIVGVVGVLALLVALLVGAIAGSIAYKFNHNEASDQARAYLRTNELLKRDIGEVKDFGWLVSGNISSQNADGDATLYLKVIGERRSVNATVNLAYRSNRNWRVTGASYERDGQTVDLMQGYETGSPPPVRKASPSY